MFSALTGSQPIGKCAIGKKLHVYAFVDACISRFVCMYVYVCMRV